MDFAWRRKMNNELLRLFFENLARAGNLLPQVQRHKQGLAVNRNVRFSSSKQMLDVWRLKNSPQVRRPAVLYLHGGAFRILSKDTHWPLGALYAQAGFCVFNANYRLSPRHAFPAALEDAAEAYRFIVQRGAEYGADPEHIIVAGESAGANLTLALALMCSQRRQEPFAQTLFDLGVAPRAIVPMCGILQVSDSARFARRKRLPSFVRDRLHEVEVGYLGGQTEAELADPLRVLESDAVFDRPFPRTYSAVGTKDPILDDTRRLQQALSKRGIEHQVSYFPNEPHAFHAFLFRRAARDTWRETFSFLNVRSAI